MRPVLVEKDTRDQLAVAAEARSISTEKPFRNSAKHTETFYTARWLVFFPFKLFLIYGGMGRRGGKHPMLNAVESCCWRSMNIRAS